MIAAGIIVLTLCGSVTVGYHLLAALDRNQDSPWLAFLVATGILLGGTFLAIGVGG